MEMKKPVMPVGVGGIINKPNLNGDDKQKKQPSARKFEPTDKDIVTSEKTLEFESISIKAIKEKELDKYK